MNYGTDAAEHVGLYYMIAERLHRNGRCLTWEFEEIVSECYIYANEYLKKYDPARGCRVSTYLTKALYLYLSEKYRRNEWRRGITQTTKPENAPRDLPADINAGDGNIISHVIVGEFMDQLTEEERETVDAMGGGYTQREMGRSLGMSREWYRVTRLEDWVRPFAAEWFGVKRRKFVYGGEPAPIGKRYGYLVVTAEGDRGKKQQRTLRCICDCGGIVDVRASSLRRGDVKSCGCLGPRRNKKRLKSIRRGENGKFLKKEATCKHGGSAQPA